MFGILDFLSMANNHDERMVDRYESDNFIIDTCLVTDGAHDYETAVRSPLYNNSEWIVVEAYDTKDEAQKGHDNWVDTMTNNPPDKLVECLNSEVSQWVGESEYKREEKEQMMKFTTEELKMLADGAPPRYVRTGWDCATVIPELAELILKTYSFVFKMEDYILKTEEDKEK